MTDNHVPPWIPGRPQLAVVGQSPGQTERRKGRPFVGPSGQLLRDLLESAGLDPDEDVAYMNVTNDFHPEEPNYNPKGKEITYARDTEIPHYLEICGDTIQAVLLLGLTASKLAFKGTMGQIEGRSTTLWGHPIFATYHPSALLRDPGKRPERESAVEETIHKVASIILEGESWDVQMPEFTTVAKIVIGPPPAPVK